MFSSPSAANSCLTVVDSVSRHSCILSPNLPVRPCPSPRFTPRYSHPRAPLLVCLPSVLICRCHRRPCSTPRFYLHLCATFIILAVCTPPLASLYVRALRSIILTVNAAPFCYSYSVSRYSCL